MPATSARARRGRSVAPRSRGTIPYVSERFATPAPPVDLATLVPELAGYARSTTRLHPRRGTPTVRQSSLGGPLLWPADEPWPACEIPWWYWDIDVPGAAADDTRPHTAPNPLVPVLQLFAADAPTISYPRGSDLLQVLWCPVPHLHLPDNDEAFAPAVALRWRNAADMPDTAAEPPAPIDYEEELRPMPCVLHPEQVAEYPMDLPEDLWSQIEDLQARHSGLSYQSDLSVAPGTKVGGWPRWHAFDPYPMACTACGQPLDLLAAFGTHERDDGCGRWNPPDLAGTDESGNFTGLLLGRGGDLQVFYCTAHPDHPVHVHVQG